MYNLAIDPDTGDLIIGRGATRIGGIDYTAQLVRSRLQTILGEWEPDPSLGIDWLTMMGNNAPLSEYERKIRTTILDTNGVRAIVSLNMLPDYRSRRLAVTFVLASIYGSVEGAVINLGAY